MRSSSQRRPRVYRSFKPEQSISPGCREKPFWWQRKKKGVGDFRAVKDGDLGLLDKTVQGLDRPHE